MVSLLAAERQMFLATWKDIPNENEVQFQIKDCSLSAGGSQPCRRTRLSSQLVTSSPQLSQPRLQGGGSSFPLCPPRISKRELLLSLMLTGRRNLAAPEVLYPLGTSPLPGTVAVAPAAPVWVREAELAHWQRGQEPGPGSLAPPRTPSSFSGRSGAKWDVHTWGGDSQVLSVPLAELS